MASDITSGRTCPGKPSQGGLKNAFFVPYIENGFTHANGTVTGLNVGITEVFKYVLKSDNNKLTETMVGSKENGTTVVNQELILSLKKIDAATQNEVKLLSHNYPHIIVQDQMDNYQIVGLQDGCNVTSAPKETGGGKGDFNGFNLTFSSQEAEYAPILDAATVTALLALVSTTNINP